MGQHRILAERASVDAARKSEMRILLLRPENSAQGLQEIARDFQRRLKNFLGALRAQILQCVSTEAPADG
jgi:hypothetical protein